jgi:exodeoxyribonuclease VII large subunit
VWIIGVINIGFIFKGTDLAAYRQELTGQVELEDAVDGLPVTAQALTGISLVELMASVAEAIQTKFISLVWVRAEISQFRPIKGDHYAIELVEHDTDGKMVARVQAFMWRGSASKLIAKFRLATAGDLNAGIKVMLSIKTEFSATHGIRLVIQDIDPAYTLGDIQAKLKQIRDTLAKEGVFNRNRQLRTPSEFCKVAVVSPSGARPW